MADVVYNIFKKALADGYDGTTGDVRALLLTVADTGYDDPDLDDVAELLAVGTTAEPAAGERVACNTVTSELDDTNNRANLLAATSPFASFAADAAATAVTVVFYDEGSGTDGTRTLISAHDFGSSKPLDGGIDVDPSDAGDAWIRFA